MLCKSVAAAVRAWAVHGGRASLAANARGEAPLSLDVIANHTAEEFLERTGRSFLVRSAQRGLWSVGRGRPERLLILDPIEGTWSPGLGLEATCVSAVAADRFEDPRFADVQEAAVFETRSGSVFQADRGGVLQDGRPPSAAAADRLAARDQPLESLLWSFELSAFRIRLTGALHHRPVEPAPHAHSALSNSAAFSITRLLTRELDAYADIWNRVLSERPEAGVAFERGGKSRILQGFPHDLAAGWKLGATFGLQISDVHGNPLDGTPLLGESGDPLRSCVAAAQPRVHEAILAHIEQAFAR
jgi:myo-inositol-1(or 4)-monophosphatase